MRKGHEQALSFYDFGRTTLYACASDQRFSYCAYVPESYDEDSTQRYPLMVSVHGTLRDVEEYREVFVQFAETHQVIVLAPLFPAGITRPAELSSYKLIRADELRYDHVLLSMVDEISARYRIEGYRFGLFGFSGGGHFTHRFFYLHPHRLSAISIGAPGVVTLLDFDHDFWVGVRDFEKHFGQKLDLESMRQVDVQMVIGGDDTDTWEIAINPGDAWWMEGAQLAGENRQQRMFSLKSSFENVGISVRHDVVPGVVHDHRGVMDAARDFLGESFTRYKLKGRGDA